MDNFSKATSKAFHADVKKALEAIAKKYELSLEMGNAKFSPTSWNGKFTFKTKNALSPIDEYHEHLKLVHPKLVDKEITMSGSLFKIIGYKQNARKNDLIIECITSIDGKKIGKKFVTSSDSIYKELGIAIW